MNTVDVKMRGMVHTTRYGTLNTGDILRTDADFAKHLVEDCGAAEYVDAQPQGEKMPAAEPKTRTKRETK